MALTNMHAADPHAEDALLAAINSKQDADPEISALAAVQSAPDTLPYFTAKGVAAVTALTTLARTILAGTDVPTILRTLGLDQVNNTADLAKPISAAVAFALTQAMDRSNHTGTQPASTISDLAQVIGSLGIPTGSITVAKLAAEVSNRIMPVGSVLPWLGEAATVPPGWVLAYGQNLDRVKYAAIFAIFGTKYGTGNGSTTFGMPDLRGRVLAFADNMGGTAAQRLTAAGSGVDGNTVGASGGSQRMQTHYHPYSWQNTSAHNENHHGAQGDKTFNFTISWSYSYVTSNTSNAGDGNSQNVQPTMVANGMIFTGVYA